MSASKQRWNVSFENVKRSLERGRLPHALLFLGPQGAGQMAAARQLASALFCGQRKGGSACGKCVSCRLVDAGNHPDLRIVDLLEDKKTIGIEQVREMTAQANLKPYQAPAKVFVIDRAETMRDEAQNALLKTLEEPPPQTYLVLISYAAEKMLSTVRSRAQEVRFSFAGEGPDAETEGQERAVIDFLLGKPAPDLSGLTRDKALAVLEAVIRDLRAALLAGVGAARAEGRPGVAALAERLDTQELVDKIEKLADFREKIARNANTKLALTVLWDEL